ncbi:hypothetical protein [Nonomuraea sp. NPDC049158]|uniref:hypothetical protein n=1 Tax=Nonomuraea sp. NPDC049158 TaxID=3155649 RepID=UPI0033FB9E02
MAAREQADAAAWLEAQYDERPHADEPYNDRPFFTLKPADKGGRPMHWTPRKGEPEGRLP